MQDYKGKFNSYEGHETFVTGSRMQIKMHVRIFIFLTLVFMVLSVVYLHFVANQNGIRFSVHNLKYLLYNSAKTNFIKLFVAVIIFHPVVLYLFRAKSQKQSDKKYIRGAKLIAPEQFNREYKAKINRRSLPLGSINMPVDLENRQTIIIGKPGTGKTQCFRKILQQVIKNNGHG